MNSTAVEKFGKDHWSLLAYVEHCCVNGHGGFGELDRCHMRGNAHTHPTLSFYDAWKLSYSTRLAGFFEFEGRGDPEKSIAAGLMLRDHDDWDCLADLEAAGYVEVMSLVNGLVKMTDTGCAVAAKLRAHKARGGHFADFRLVDDAGSAGQTPSEQSGQSPRKSVQGTSGVEAGSWQEP